MTASARVWSIACAVVVLALGAVGCGATKHSASSTAAPARTAATKTNTVPGATVTVAASQYGRILMTGRRFALYSFSSDSRGRSNCYAACAKRWPPLITMGDPSARGAARGSLLGTTRRRDGSRQVTYRGHPLYRYVDDIKPKQVLCQGVEEFGGLWTVVSPGGTTIH